ncbi:MAG TPA: hypothetical protein VLI65_00295 [Pyrinomonadaceae bacterium]|nr:hypothetical protein [Pyrinomonadaceae bacterium]
MKTVGVLIAAIGEVLLWSGLAGNVSPGIVLLAITSAAALATVDINYAFKGVISKIYLLDAITEGCLVFFGSLRLSRNMFNLPFAFEDDLAIAVFKRCFVERQATFYRYAGANDLAYRNFRGLSSEALFAAAAQQMLTGIDKTRRHDAPPKRQSIRNRHQANGSQRCRSPRF